jgi:hypothetical protein
MKRLCLLLALLWCHSARAELIQVPLLVHVAEESGAPVAAQSFLDDQLEHANAIYRPLGFELVIAGRRAMENARLVTREDRDALAPRMVSGVLNWFVVAQLMDVDEPGRERRGVHWHVRKAPGKRYVIVSAISASYVLAHELGHFFGNPSHSEVVGNLMSYQHTDAVPVLDEAQRTNVLRVLRGMRARGELVSLQRARRTLRSRP